MATMNISLPDRNEGVHRERGGFPRDGYASASEYSTQPSSREAQKRRAREDLEAKAPGRGLESHVQQKMTTEGLRRCDREAGSPPIAVGRRKVEAIKRKSVSPKAGPSIGKDLVKISTSALPAKPRVSLADRFYAEAEAAFRRTRFRMPGMGTTL